MTLIGTASALWLGNTTQVTNNGVDPSLVGWWKLDGNAKDSSGNNNNGTISGSVSPVVGPKGLANTAMSFHGGQVSASNSALPFGTQSLTMSAWVYDNSYTSYQSIIGWGAPGGNQSMILSLNSSGNVQADAYGDDCVGSLVVSLNSWHFVAFTFNGGGSTQGHLWLDSSSVSCTFSAIPNIGNGPVNIGNYATHSYNGNISNIRIYSRALSSAEIARLYKPPIATLDSSQTGLIGWWKLNGNTKDSTPYGQSGSWFSGTAAYTTDRKGQTNGAASFANNCIKVSSNLSLMNKVARPNITLSAWIYPTDNGGLGRQIVGDNAPWLLLIRNGDVQFGLQFSDTNWQWLDSSAGSVALNQWQLITATYNGTTMAEYINGVQVASYTPTSPYTRLNPILNNLSIGCDVYNSQKYFKGSIADVRIYNRALSPTEIKTQYQSYNSQIMLQAPKPASSVNLTSGLVGYWPFNGNTKDLTVYQNNSTITGGVTLTTDRNGKANSAYAFDGSSGYMTISDTSSIKAAYASGESTYSMWYKAAAANNTIFFRGEAHACTYAPNINMTHISLTGCSGSGNLLYTAGISMNTWHLLTLVFDVSNNSAKLYIDGLLYNSASVSPSNFSSINGIQTVLGASYNSTDTPQYGGFLNGALDDVRIYNRALSATEVKTLYNTYY